MNTLLSLLLVYMVIAITECKGSFPHEESMYNPKIQIPTVRLNIHEYTYDFAPASTIAGKGRSTHLHTHLHTHLPVRQQTSPPKDDHSSNTSEKSIAPTDTKEPHPNIFDDNPSPHAPTTPPNIFDDNPSPNENPPNTSQQ